MLQVASGTKVHLALRPLSMRYGFDGLSARVASILQQDPFSGHLFLFRSKRGDYLKILYWDGSGLCLFAKRLEKGRFVWPPIVDGALQITPGQLALLLEASIGGGRCSRLCQCHRRPSKTSFNNLYLRDFLASWRNFC